MSVKVKKRSGQRDMSILFRKNSKISAFLTKTGRKKIGKKISQHSAQLDGVPSISAKKLAFPSSL